jgi:hypothetical protein
MRLHSKRQRQKQRRKVSTISDSGEYCGDEATERKPLGGQDQHRLEGDRIS